MQTDKDFCVVIFSHADDKNKEQMLFESISSMKKLNLKIILASHIPVSERNQSLCDYFIKDDNNLILKESDIFKTPCNLDKLTFNSTDFFGGLKFETYIFKKTYQPGILNLYIGACNLAKKIGFKNIIFWEYDYILGDDSVKFFQENMDIFLRENLESISFNSQIFVFNYDIIQSVTDCTYAAPNIFSVDKFLSSVPDKYIETSNEYTQTTELMILEQWFKEKITNKCLRKLEYPYGQYDILLSDTSRANVTSQNNYLYISLKSGLYFNENKSIICFNNSSDLQIRSNFKIYDENENIILEKDVIMFPHQWYYDYVNDEIYQKLKSVNGCRVIEQVEDVKNNTLDIFEYKISQNNFDFVSKLKRFFILG